MREIVLDTETSGLHHEYGAKLVEIGCIELIDTKPTDNKFHVYLNPQTTIDQKAFEVHGLSEERLSIEPVFADIADDFLKFIGTSPLVIHNAKFDLGFINAELSLAGKDKIEWEQVRDSLAMAKLLLPFEEYGGKYNLDALAIHFGIMEGDRGLHGALKDSALLAKVYWKLVQIENALNRN